MYKVRLTAKAKKQLKKLSIQERFSLGEIIENIKDNPLVGKSLGRELTGKYSYRIGAYRVIYQLNSKDKVIIILEADHRERIYN